MTPKIAPTSALGTEQEVETMVTEPWLDPEFVGQGRVPMHTIRHEPLVDLDGIWRFQLLPRADAAAAAEWRDIEVPGCWTMQDTSDGPIYTNTQMPFEHMPPHVPEANPTGVYERSFVLQDADITDGRLILHVGAAESVLIASINGQHVGASKDSHLAAEFDISGLVRSGSNTVRLRVVKWSDASFIEDQDQWWHGGITRSVYIYRTPDVYLADIHAHAGLADDPSTGVLEVDVIVGSGSGRLADGWAVEAVLEDSPPVPPTLLSGFDLPYWPDNAADRALLRRHEIGGEAAVVSDLPAWEALRQRLEPPREGRARLCLQVAGVEPWSAEIPRLYDLSVRLLSPDGSVAEVVEQRVGFRSVEVDGTDLLINGQRVFIRGVNRHDFDQRSGRVVSTESMRADLVAMKRVGFNAVRTAHYPNDPVFLDLADELGLYIVEEADIEAHAFQASLGHDPRYLAQWLARVSRMVQRDRNHASVVVWSLGNEFGSRRQSRRRGSLGSTPRPIPPAPVRGRHPTRLECRRRDHRPDVPDVPRDRRHRGVRPIRTC